MQRTAQLGAQEYTEMFNLSIDSFLNQEILQSQKRKLIERNSFWSNVTREKHDKFLFFHFTIFVTLCDNKLEIKLICKTLKSKNQQKYTYRVSFLCSS